MGFFGKKSNEAELQRGRGDTLRDKAASLWSRGTFSTRKTIAEGEFGGSHLLDRAFFDWTGKPWFVPLNPLFFVITLVGLITLVFYGLYDIIGRLNTFDDSLQRALRSLGVMASSLGAAMLAQLFLYLVTHIIGAKSLVLACFLLHSGSIGLLYWKELWAGAALCTFTFVIVWPFLWVKFQSLDIANAHIKVWKEMLVQGEERSKCPCTGGYGYNILSNIILVNILGFIFLLIWSFVFMGYAFAAHTNMSYEEDTDFSGINQAILYGLFIMGFWGCETLKNVMYSLLGYICVVWSKSSESYSICTSTSVRVWITNFGANSYAAFVLPILEPLHTGAYFFLAPWVTKSEENGKEADDFAARPQGMKKAKDACKGGCGCLSSLIETYAMGIQEMTVYYNYKGLLMTVCFGVPFVEGSEMTAYIPKEENPIMPYLAVLSSCAGGSLACFVACYWGDQDNLVWTWRDYLAFLGLIGGYFQSGVTMMAMRGAADATDFLRHDDGGKTYNRGRDTFVKT